MSLGDSEKTRREIVDWIVSEARIPEIAVGETYTDSEGLIVEIHVEEGCLCDRCNQGEKDGRCFS